MSGKRGFLKRMKLGAGPPLRSPCSACKNCQIKNKSTLSKDVLIGKDYCKEKDRAYCKWEKARTSKVCKGLKS